MFAHKSFVLAWLLRISKHKVWVSQSILLQLLPMRTQIPNLLCASAFVRQSRTFHSINALLTFYRMHTFLNWWNILSCIPFGSDLDPNRVANGEREREREVQAHQSKHCIGGSTNRERGVCVLFEFRQYFFFTLGTRLCISKFCVDLCKRNLSTINAWVEFEVGRASESVLVFCRKNEIV